jgi:hypothetical protein
MDPIYGHGSAKITDTGALESEIAHRNGEETAFKARRTSQRPIGAI